MVALNRVRVALTGFAGGPGVATFHFLNLATARDSLQDLWTNLAGSMPDDVTVQVESSGDIIESTTGQLSGSWSEDPLPPIAGLSTVGYAAPAGYMVRWNTGAIIAGKRVRGRTFVVPLSGGAYATNGSLVDVLIGQVEAATQAFVFAQSSDFVIWSRPFLGAPAVPPSPAVPSGRPARPARLGAAALVTSSTVPDKVVVLRSRRD